MSLRHASVVVMAALSLVASACKKEEPARPAAPVAAPGAPAAPAAAPGAGDKIAAGAKQVGQGIAEGAKQAWEATKSGAKVAADTVAEGAKFVGDKVAAGAKVVAAEASDGWLTTKVKTKIGVSRLFAVSVDTVAGVVTLSGKAKSEAEKAEFEKLARETDGVKQVVNKLAVEAAPAAPAAPAR